MAEKKKQIARYVYGGAIIIVLLIGFAYYYLFGRRNKYLY